MDLVVRSIDVGYGNTKYIVATPPGGLPQCSMFPSLAPHSQAVGELSSEFMMRRQTVRVRVGDAYYEVGKDSSLAIDPYYTREQDTRYALSDPYLALVRGAFFYQGVEVVDMLMLGLPCSTFDQFNEELKARVIGVHKVPNPLRRSLGDPDVIEVDVRAVNVLPQPMGAYFDYAIRNKVLTKLRSERTLIVDPGYFTLDWVVAEGTKMVGNRSHGQNNGGVKSLLEKVAAELARDVGEAITDLTLIDRALYTKQAPRFYGREYDLSKYMDGARSLARQHVSALTAKVGTGVDIDNIILAGGGAPLFKDAVQEKFPKHTIMVTDDPAYANVRGFQMLGMQWASQQSHLAARSRG